MRGILLLIVLGGLAASAPAASASETPGDFGHLNVDYRRDIGPGQAISYHLDPNNPEAMSEITLREGWLFAVYGGVESGAAALLVNLTHSGAMVRQWQWALGPFHFNSTRLPVSGDYNLTVWNPGGNGSDKYSFYFDQSCNCAGKLIPLPGGSVMFNYDVPKGRQVRVDIPMVQGWIVEGTVATVEGDRGKWPNDFTELVHNVAEGPAWLNFSFRADRTDRYFVVLHAQQGARLCDPNDDSCQMLELTPVVDVSKGSASPGPDAPIVATALLGAAAFAAARRRSG